MIRGEVVSTISATAAQVPLLAASAREQTHRDVPAAAVAADRNAVSLAEKQYAKGLTDFINMLQVRQALFNTENALVHSTAAVSTNFVTLCKVLGGGRSVIQIKRPERLRPPRTVPGAGEGC